MSFESGYVGKNAYKVSKVWRLGFHAFDNGEDFIVRLVYFRNSHATYYIQLSIKVRQVCECE